LQAYDDTAWQSKAGGVATLATLALAGPLLPLALVRQAVDEGKVAAPSPELVAQGLNTAIRAAWELHDALLAPVFGSGSCSGAANGADDSAARS
jgi:hypothetical protein